MHFSASFVLAALPFLVTARTPLKARRASTSTYTLTAIHSGDEEVHNQPIVAADEHFFIGRQSSAACNVTSKAPDCATKYPTQIELAPPTEPGREAELTVSVPGGQYLYIDFNCSLAFTSPHGHTFAGFNGPFSLDPPSNETNASVHNLAFGIYEGESSKVQTGWFACPTESDNQTVYQIFNNLTNSGCQVDHCHGIAIALQSGNSSAIPTEYQ